MDISNVLNKFRHSGYSKKMDDKDTSSSSPRMIKLSADEVKSLQSDQMNLGEEIVLQITGKLEQDGHFHVLSVGQQGGGEEDNKDMAAEIAGKSPMIPS